MKIKNPVKKGYSLRLPKPLPRYVKDEELKLFFKAVKTRRDRAMFMLMLRCGLRVEEVAHLSRAAIDFKRRRILVVNGKGGKGRVVYLSNDAYDSLLSYLQTRPAVKTKKLFLVEKGLYKGNPLSVRGIQKRMEYYAKKAGIKMSCHQLRHTMATQMLNAEADIVTIQDGVSCMGQGLERARGEDLMAASDRQVAMLRRLWNRELGALREGRPLTQWRIPDDLATTKGVEEA
jgi:site-specific recombinase XerD